MNYARFICVVNLKLLDPVQRLLFKTWAGSETLVSGLTSRPTCRVYHKKCENNQEEVSWHPSTLTLKLYEPETHSLLANVCKTLSLFVIMKPGVLRAKFLSETHKLETCDSKRRAKRTMKKSPKPFNLKIYEPETYSLLVNVYKAPFCRRFVITKTSVLRKTFCLETYKLETCDSKRSAKRTWRNLQNLSA